ncbi:MAG TPA: ATP-binding protein, partial [Roseiarcus sp.]|nr:ATP-binding protein [Roseiarcus sp.]
RQAGHAFIEMKNRIERATEQRTAMLNGVSHDLRTILTRFKLSVALIDNSADSELLQKDVDEMGRMLEGYLAFARGDASESTVRTDVKALLDDLRADAERHGAAVSLETHGDLAIPVRPIAIKRCVGNLVANAQRHADHVWISAKREPQAVAVVVDDDGVGIPQEHREDVFRPFYRLDEARNQDEGGAGLGLAIARDIARSHGGDIILADSPMGGLRAVVRLPV